MSKHTPGPWRATVDCKVRGTREQWSMGIMTDEFVADVGGCDKATAQANASLIAAAPEMLEALREAWNWLADNDESHTGTAQRIKAAIAKAEGSGNE